MNFIINSKRFISEILKNAITKKIKNTKTAATTQITLLVFWNWLKAIKAPAVPIARIKIWTSETLIGPTFKVNQAKIPFWIFLGKTAFMHQLKSKKCPSIIVETDYFANLGNFFLFNASI